MKRIVIAILRISEKEQRISGVPKTENALWFAILIWEVNGYRR